MKHLLNNAGWSGLLRLLFVGLIMTLIAVMSKVAMGLPIWLVALLLGALGGQWLAGRPQKGLGILQGAGLLLTVAAVAFGFARDQLDLDLQTDNTIRLILLPTGLYLGAYLRFMGHPNVVILREGDVDSTSFERPDNS